MPAEVATLGVLDRFRLDGKVAIVTGASSGLGVAFAMALAEAGADLGLGARRTEGLISTQKAVEGLGRRATYVATDVSRPEDCAALVDAVFEEYGRVDVLVNNAGVSDAVPALKQSPDDFRRVVDVNLNGSYWMAQACARVMGPGSSIINIASVIGITQGDIPSAGYSSSKAALVGLTHDLAGQWTSRKGIRVNGLVPGYIGTEMTQPLVDNEKLYATVLGRTPMGRFGEPVELCGALLFLASDASSFVTGIMLPVDGGWMMR
jgi:NAD(P)-dependent dehydrogenase (short-subunit alcohol dehydrogenase family)